jgi:hypothetical protein
MDDTLYKGVEWRRVITVTEEDTGDAVDLTGLDIVLTLKRRGSEAALVTVTDGDGITLQTQSGDTVGMANIVIEASATLGLESAAHQISVLVDDQVVVPPFKVQVRDV